MTSRIDGRFLTAWLRQCARDLERERDMLCRLDGEVGDGDHGISMADGLAAAARSVEAAGSSADPAHLMQCAASAFLNEVGASVGPLYASAFMRAGTKLVADAGIADLLDAMHEGIAERGKASVGDRTMVDAWEPAARAAASAAKAGGSMLGQALAAREAAYEGAEATRSLIAARGRAVRLGSRCLGHIDPGALSAAIMVNALLSVTEESA